MEVGQDEFEQLDLGDDASFSLWVALPEELKFKVLNSYVEGERDSGQRLSSVVEARLTNRDFARLLLEVPAAKEWLDRDVQHIRELNDELSGAIYAILSSGSGDSGGRKPLGEFEVDPEEAFNRTLRVVSEFSIMLLAPPSPKEHMAAVSQALKTVIENNLSALLKKMQNSEDGLALLDIDSMLEEAFRQGLGDLKIHLYQPLHEELLRMIGLQNLGFLLDMWMKHR